jgi:RimJ/RimL family protein N-acetyltransferase
MSLALDLPMLHGHLVRLEPLGSHHAEDLAGSAEEGRSTFGHTWGPRGSEVEEYLEHQLQQSEASKLTPFAQIRLTDERAVGCTAYWDPRTRPSRPGLCAVEIGWTWLASSAQRTGINVESKFLLLRHAFEQLGVARVDIKTAARNARSRRRSRDLEPTSRVSCAIGRSRRRPVKRASYVTRRCIRSLIRNGRLAGLA